MQIKRLFITITVLFCLLLPNLVHAQRHERPIVKLIYFLPRDRQPQPNINGKIDSMIKDTQRFYADHMENHGFGRKTFLYETDARGNAIVHHIKGKFRDTHYHNLSSIVWEEIKEHVDLPGSIYLTLLDISSEIIGLGENRDEVCGLGGAAGSHTGIALMPASGDCFNLRVAAHELGHSFGLLHDFRNDTFLMSYGGGIYLSPCDAEWLDVHRALNASQPAANKQPTIEMLPPSLAASPNAIRFRFKITDPEGLHQARLHTKTIVGLGVGAPEVVSCKRLNGNPSTTAELITTYLGADNKSVSLQVIDTNGNFMMSKEFPVNIASLLPRARTVSIPDANLAAAIRQEIGSSITTHTILNLTRLDARNRGIKNLTGLEHAQHLKELNLSWEYINARGFVNSNNISNLSPLANLTQLTLLYLSKNSISNISTLSKMTQLVYLDISDNTISDISALSQMTQLDWLDLSNNTISDISALSQMTQLDWLDLSNNTISNLLPLTELTHLRKLDLEDNDISDISALAKMTQLTNLHLSDNSISDISALAKMTRLIYLSVGNNLISDISPLVRSVQLRADLTGVDFFLHNNPLSYTSIYTHIPAIQAKGITVWFAPRTPTTMVKILGDTQQGTLNTTLPLPFVVEVRDDKDRTFEEVPVTFTVTTGNGKLNVTKTTTDSTGRAEALLTLGQTGGTTRVQVSAEKISHPLEFTAKAVLRTETITIPDAALRTEIARSLGKPRGDPITMMDMLRLTALSANAVNIHDLTGLQHAVTLTTLSLNNNSISDIKPLAGLVQLKTLSLNNNRIREVTSLASLTQLKILSLDDNHISDVSSLVGLSQLETLSINNNHLSDIAPFTELPQLKILHLRDCLLSYPSLYTHIPTLQSGGTSVTFTPRTPTIHVRISELRGVVGETLPLVAEVQDDNGFVFSGAPVRFTTISGGGNLSMSNTITDRTGKAITSITLGATPGNNTVRTTTPKDRQPAIFTIIAISPNSIVTIPDANLQAKIAETLGKPLNSELTARDMRGLTRLEAPNVNISDLTGLEYAHSLRVLDLGSEYISGQPLSNSNTISDLSPLAGLTQLNSLDLERNEISDISPLSGLTGLSVLYLSTNSISDVSPLSGLTRLKTLDISANSISDISILSELIQLNIFFLSYNSISDISVLSELTQLQLLYLGANTVSDISPLANLTQLSELSLGVNSISDVSPLSGLTQLQRLHLLHNSISDISPLANLRELIVLYLSSNNITDVSPLVDLNLTGLQWNKTGLFLVDNPLSHASVYEHIPAMQAKGIIIAFDNRAHPILLKISGDDQAGEAGTILENPIVVEAQNEKGEPMQGAEITFTVVTGGGSQGGIVAPIITTDANGRAQTTLTLGPTLGTNKVTVTGRGLPEVTFTATATIPANPTKAADANGDGIVNDQDIEAVTSQLGQQGENDADVNGDGVVNIADLILVIGAIEGDAAAPSLHPVLLSKFSVADIQQWLDEAKLLGETGAAYLRGIAVLEQLLIVMIPKETVLLANYPNPFNPETWIPYQLAKPAEVTLHIYAVDGTLVRKLVLGHQLAGMYHSKSRAVYWDGQNAQGEPVASGIYFYMLTADDFAATRKMLIRK